jgi:hypothetical protein
MINFVKLVMNALTLSGLMEQHRREPTPGNHERNRSTVLNAPRQTDPPRPRSCRGNPRFNVPQAKMRCIVHSKSTRVGACSAAQGLQVTALVPFRMLLDTSIGMPTGIEFIDMRNDPVGVLGSDGAQQSVHFGLQPIVPFLGLWRPDIQ